MRRGFVAISTVLVISVVVLAMTISVSRISLGSLQIAGSVARGGEALFLTEGCMEEALTRVRSNAAYMGGVLTRPEGSCTVSINKAGSVWTLDATNNDTRYKRTVRVVVTRTGNGLNLSSWKEI